MRFTVFILLTLFLSGCYVYRPLEELEDEEKISLSSTLKMGKTYDIKSKGKSYKVNPIAWRKDYLITDLETKGEYEKEINIKDIQEINDKKIFNGNIKENDTPISLKNFIKKDKFYKIKMNNLTYKLKLIGWNDNKLIGEINLIGYNKKSFHKKDIQKVNNLNVSNGVLNIRKNHEIKDLIDNERLYNVTIGGSTKKMRLVAWDKDSLLLKVNTNDVKKFHKNDIQKIDNLPISGGSLIANTKLSLKDFLEKNKSYKIKSGGVTFESSLIDLKNDSITIIMRSMKKYEKRFRKNDIEEINNQVFSNGFLVQQKEVKPISQQIEKDKFYKIKTDDKIYKIKAVKWEGDSLIAHINLKEKNERKFHKDDIKEVNHRIFSRGRSDAITVGIYGGIAGLILLLLK